MDYYAILGVPATASLEVIREAYRELSSFSLRISLIVNIHFAPS